MAGACDSDKAQSSELGAVAEHPPSQSTSITPHQFLLWKQTKDAAAMAKAMAAAKKRADDLAAGRVRMNGRELFEHEPWVFDDSRFE
ncbi:hypothetical protein O6H91_23G003100 [Diphasiastrum complanatum]|uniref:Uncharacterized protein n=1 Tax=Diphasiastrum complanatum TaxID=34168 RepID=A0ACC2A7M7_DIPCM|nr:hypothetical protein O6H91_23G003100 [Diphasiastrum complanatum]